MDADLDLLLIAVYCTVDDLLPKRPGNARRRISDAEVITLCVAQAMLGIPSDRRFLATARWRLGHLFAHLPERSAFHERRLRLSGVIESLIREFARNSPGFYDDLLLVDSTPVECARSRETVKRGGQSSLANAISNAADYGYCASHSRWFWGFRLHTLFALDGTPRALALNRQTPEAARRPWSARRSFNGRQRSAAAARPSCVKQLASALDINSTRPADDRWARLVALTVAENFRRFPPRLAALDAVRDPRDEP